VAFTEVTGETGRLSAATTSSIYTAVISTSNVLDGFVGAGKFNATPCLCGCPSLRLHCLPVLVLLSHPPTAAVPTHPPDLHAMFLTQVSQLFLSLRGFSSQFSKTSSSFGKSAVLYMLAVAPHRPSPRASSSGGRSCSADARGRRKGSPSAGETAWRGGAKMAGLRQQVI